MIKNGTIDINKPLVVYMPSENMRLMPKWLPKITNLAMAGGTPEAGVIGKSFLVICGIYTGGGSFIHFHSTPNQLARIFYCASIFFSVR